MLAVTRHDLVRFTAVFSPDGVGEIDQGIGPIVDTLVVPVEVTGPYTLTVTDQTGTGTKDVAIEVTQDPTGDITISNLEEDNWTVDTRVHPTFTATMNLPVDNTVFSEVWHVVNGTFTGTGPITVTPGDIDTCVVYCDLTDQNGLTSTIRRTVNIRPSLPTVNVLQTYAWGMALNRTYEHELRPDDRHWSINPSTWDQYPGRRFRIDGVMFGMQVKVTLNYLSTTDGFDLDLQAVRDQSDAGFFWRSNYDAFFGNPHGKWFIFDPQPDNVGDLVVEVNAANAKNGPWGPFSLFAEHGVWISGPTSINQNGGGWFSVPDSPGVAKTWTTSGAILDPILTPDAREVYVNQCTSYPNFTITCTIHFPGGDIVATLTIPVNGM